jgi:hypothetical protein
MFMKYCPLILFIFQFICSFGQSDTSEKKNVNTIRLYAGPGYTAVRHEIVDKDRYDGFITPLGVEWERQTSKRTRKLYASVNAGNIKSDIDDAKIMNINIGADYNFLLYKFNIVQNNPGIYIGPSLYIYTHMRDQERIDLNDYKRTIGIIALGPNLAMKGNISGNIYYSGMFRMNILCFGGHDNFSTAFLSPFKGFHSSFSLGIDWQVRERTGFVVRYRFDYSNINEWVDFVTGSDILLLGFNLKL